MGYILITGGNLKNKGAQSMIFITVDEMRKRFPDKEIVVVSDPDATGDSKQIRDYDFMFRDSVCLYGWKYKLIQHRYGKLDLYGDAKKIRTNTDMIVDISGYTFGSNWSFISNILAAYRARCAQKLGVPIYYMPQSFGPFDWKGLTGHLADRCIRKWLPYAKVLYVREQEGMELLKKHYGFENVSLSADLVLQNRGVDRSHIYTGTQSQETWMPKEISVVREHSVAILPNIRNMKYGNPDELMRAYCAVIDHLLDAHKNVYLIRHATEDLSVCQKIKDRYLNEERVLLIGRDVNCLEYEELIQNFEYLIASRYHAIVHAYKQGIPCIVLGWAVKYQELLYKVEQSSYAVDVRKQIDIGALLHLIDRMEENYEKESETIRTKLQGIQEQNVFDTLGEEKEYTIARTTAEDLCCYCGTCAAVCPKQCICFEKHRGSYIPVIDTKVCVKCGKCLHVCPGYEYSHDKGNKTECGEQIRNGRCLSVQVKDKKILEHATSGGFVTGMIRALLENDEYHAAFLVDGYDYSGQMQSVLIKKGDPLEQTQRSRYLPVSQERAISYILQHPEEKIIYVAVPCAVHGLHNALKAEGRNTDSILIIGLFCDKTMTYSLYDYIKCGYLDGKKKDHEELRTFHFRDKRAGGWPGNMRLEYADGSSAHVSAKERMIVKDFFQAERCLFCYDKLNEEADFSVGDNYTGKHASKEGTNSLIIRTQKAEMLWNRYAGIFESYESSFEEIRISQHLCKKQIQQENNKAYACLRRGRSVESGYPQDLYGIIGAEQKIREGRALSALRKQEEELMLGEQEAYDRINRRKLGKRILLYAQALRIRLRG